MSEKHCDVKPVQGCESLSQPQYSSCIDRLAVKLLGKVIIELANELTAPTTAWKPRTVVPCSHLFCPGDRAHFG